MMRIMFGRAVSGGLIGIKPVFMTTYRDAPPGASYGLSFQSVTSMYEDRDGKIWIGTDGEVLICLIRKRDFPEISSDCGDEGGVYHAV